MYKDLFVQSPLLVLAARGDVPVPCGVRGRRDPRDDELAPEMEAAARLPLGDDHERR